MRDRERNISLRTYINLAFSPCTFLIISPHIPVTSTHFLTFECSLREKEIKHILKKIFDIYLKVKIGEMSIVILGHANHSSEVIISIHIEQVLYDENLKSRFPRISWKFK